MLIAFRDIMVHFDPDVITGYNICNFDCDYLKKRAEALQIGSNFCSLTRMKEIRMDVREVTFESAQVGKRKSNKVSIKGRSVLDVYKWMKDNFSLEEYSLNAVSSKFLGDTKEDIHFTEITPKWLLGPETRRELGIYCLKDALLPLHLMDKLNITLNAIERARVTGLPCEWVLNRGMLVRFTSQLMRESNEKGYMLPYIDSESPLRRETTKYTGATVLDVERGLWTNVAVLDFSSMYPCQIIAENLCYCTYLGQHSWSPHDDLQVRPLYFQGHKFVNEKDRKGIIPCILERMLKQRKIAKAAFAQENDDPVKKLVLKARELSYKVVCNGIYGALGCKNALIPLRAIAETTTGLGRKDIQRVKEIAESMFTTSNGYAGNAKVVCGDTDSVFVSMPVTLGLSGMEAIAESMRFATLLADTVNAEMKSPKKIEPEKVFANILLMKKKRYAGLKYETLVDEPKIDIKGIECVRRDGCPLVRNLVRETVECLARTADVDAAAQLVRQMVDKVMSDSIPDEDYAIKKMLRKTIQDCAHPMTPQEVVHIRKAIDSDKTAAHLTEEEQDKAIRMGVKLRWRIFRKLPHIMVAWKLRQKDPGNAPVLGESVRYVISLNGGKQVSEKAEPLEFVLKGKILVDRHFYLASLRKAIDGIFSPIIEQRNPSFKIVSQQPDGSKLKSKEHHKKKEKMESDQFNKSVKKAVEDLLWRQLLEGKLSKNSEKQRAIVQQSPIMQAFMRASSKKPKGA